MTTATVAFGVADLALEKAQGADNRLARKPSRFFALLTSTFTGMTVKLLRTKAKDLADLAVWFRGAKAKLAEELADGELHAPGKLVAALEKTERDILMLREKMLESLVLEEQHLRRGALTHAMRDWLNAAADFHDALVAFRWAAMEADADADIKYGRLESFESVDDLLAELRS